MLYSHNYDSSNIKDSFLNSLVLYHLGHLHCSLLYGNCTSSVVTKKCNHIYFVSMHMRLQQRHFLLPYDVHAYCIEGILVSRQTWSWSAVCRVLYCFHRTSASLSRPAAGRNVWYHVVHSSFHVLAV